MPVELRYPGHQSRSGLVMPGYPANIEKVVERIGLPATVVRDEDWPGVYHLQPRLTAEPKVSIVIPTGGQ